MVSRCTSAALRTGLVGLLCGLGALGAAAVSSAATVPTGFAETQIATGLANPTAMAFAPDGRLFVAEQGGRLRVIKNGDAARRRRS